MGDGSGGFITRHGALALVGAVPAQNRKFKGGIDVQEIKKIF